MQNGEIGEIFAQDNLKVSSYNQKALDLLIPDCKRQQINFFKKVLQKDLLFSILFNKAVSLET